MTTPIKLYTYLLSYTWPEGPKIGVAGSTVTTKETNTTPEKATRSLERHLERWCAKHGHTRPPGGWNVKFLRILL